MLPRRFQLHPIEEGTLPDGTGMLKQASFALLAVLVLAFAVVFATEALALLTPTDALAIVP